MSMIFGRLMQTAYVVKDIEDAMQYWIKNLGVGPWFYRQEVATQNFMYHGKPSPIEMSIALSYSGEMQIELIQQRNDAPSVYKEFMTTIGYGQQHLGFAVQDLTASISLSLKLGYQIEQTGTITNSGEFAYLSKGSLDDYPCGTMIEFISMTQSRQENWPVIKEWANNWDGMEPIRTVI